MISAFVYSGQLWNMAYRKNQQIQAQSPKKLPLYHTSAGPTAARPTASGRLFYQAVRDCTEAEEEQEKHSRKARFPLKRHALNANRKENRGRQVRSSSSLGEGRQSEGKPHQATLKNPPATRAKKETPILGQLMIS